MDDAQVAIRHTLTQVKAFLAQEHRPRLSEADTKAHFIEPIVAALGWTGIGVITREYYVKNSQEFIDYLMAGPDGPLLALEAKPLQTDLTDKHAAQLIQYCAVEGIEWAAVTNGRELQFFNTFLKPDLAAKRLVRLDLLAFNSDVEFDALFAQVWQLSRPSMTTPAGVRSWLHQRRLDASLRTILLNPGSPAIKHLRKALADAEVTATSQDVVQWFRAHLSPTIASLPVPRQAAIANLAHQTPPAEASNDFTAPRRVETDTTQPFDATTSKTFGGRQRGLLPLFGALHQAIDQRWSDTTWRALKYYVAAETDDATFLAVKTRSQGLVVGLTLPADAVGPRLIHDADQFNWARMTKVTRIESEADIDGALLDLIERARSHGVTSRHKAHFGVSLSDLLDAGLLDLGTPLVLVGKGNREVARATLNSNGEIVWQGKAHRSPSDRSFGQLLDLNSFNGWQYWHAELPEGRVPLTSVRSRLQDVVADVTRDTGRASANHA